MKKYLILICALSIGLIIALVVFLRPQTLGGRMISFDTNGLQLATTNNNGNDANTKLLIIGDGAHATTTFTDNSASAHTVTTNGNAQYTRTKKLGNQGSMIFDGTGDSLTIADHADWDITGDFTIEAWVFYSDRPDLVNEVYRIAARGDVGANNGDWAFAIGHVEAWGGAGFKMNADFRTGGVVNDYQTDAMGEYDAPVNTWNHWALVRNGSDLLFFLNGTLLKTVSTATESMEGSTSMYVGARLVGAGLDEELKGLMDEVRFSSVARYTADFTPVRRHNGYSFDTTDASNVLRVPSQIKL